LVTACVMVYNLTDVTGSAANGTFERSGKSYLMNYSRIT